MSIAIGARLGPYEILAPLGAGGMGEVYRARDTRLDRTVAIKVLPAHLSADPQVRQRFEREARAVSSLSHPHICSLYDVGHQDGVDFLVMEYLEGETLAVRLERGPLLLEEVLRIATQMADALDKAHRQGVIHRDLKPGNIMLTKTGSKLLDFGLARVTGLAPGITQLSSSPTVSKPLTAEGTIVGTFQYMAPEQLEGKEADARSDIFAFGAVLYEMATGRKAFEARSQASLIAAILEREPPLISQVAPMTPPALERVVRTCLAKDPDERRQTMHDVLLELKWITEAGSQAGAPAPVTARRKRREMVLAGAVAVLAVATTLLAWAYFRAASVEPLAVQTHILPPEKTMFRMSGASSSPPQISPDGTRLAFVGGTEGKIQIWVRPLASLTAQPLAGTENGSYPFWAPDSRYLGFFADAKLKKIDTFGGPPQTLCDSEAVFGGAWSPLGAILFVTKANGPIFQVPEIGGVPIQVTKLDTERQETAHRWPSFLPDGRHFLFQVLSSVPENNGIYLGSLDGEPPRRLVANETNGIYASGHLLYIRENILMAQPFNAGKLQLSGEAFPIAEGVALTPGLRATFSASQNGVLAYGRGSSSAGWQLRIFDREGKMLGTVGERGGFFNPAISPDGKRIVFAQGGSGFGQTDLWILDLARGLKTRFTFDPATENFPVWSPDGTRIVFTSNRKGNFGFYLKSASGVGEEELLMESPEEEFVNDWSPDGKFLAYVDRGQRNGGGDIWVLPLEGERKPFPFVRSSFSEVRPTFSPDGKWLAYMSNESGQQQVYIAPFPNPTSKWQVSVNGGMEPHWRNDGKEIFFESFDYKIMAAEISVKGNAIEVGKVRPLFEARTVSGPSGPFDVFPDGKRFLVNSTGDIGSSEPFILVTNWPAALKKK